jgi:hypothetical protein
MFYRLPKQAIALALTISSTVVLSAIPGNAASTPTNRDLDSLSSLAGIDETNSHLPTGTLPLLPSEATFEVSSLQFRIPSIGASRRRTSGAVRGDNCVIDPDMGLVPLTSIQPWSEDGQCVTVVETTTSNRPAFFFYLAPPLSGVAMFELRNPDNETIHSVRFVVPEEPVVLGIQLPEDVPELELGQQYDWFLTVTDTSIDQRVSGVIQRIDPEPELAQQLVSSEVSDRPAIYAESGIWYDTMTSLAVLLYESPEDETLQENWASLLASVELGNYADAPMFWLWNGTEPAVPEVPAAVNLE